MWTSEEVRQANLRQRAECADRLVREAEEVERKYPGSAYAVELKDMAWEIRKGE